MAEALLLLGLGMTSACVVSSPNDNILTPPPILLNRPPRIIELQQTPPRSLCLPLGFTDQKFHIAQASDPDLCDTLLVQWYVDFSPLDPIQNNQPVFFKIVDPPAPPSQVRDLSTADFDLLPSHLTRNGGSVSGTHVVEALVTDSAEISLDCPAVGTMTGVHSCRVTKPRQLFQTCFPPGVTNPDGGVDQTYFSTYAWTVVVGQGTCP